ncbi:hypothetical protein P8452_76153 [Trifolium repens]|nr:hypothetical protein P8452_76153 [Trifolium repens]
MHFKAAHKLLFKEERRIKKCGDEEHPKGIAKEIISDFSLCGRDPPHVPFLSSSFPPSLFSHREAKKNGIVIIGV